MNTAYAPAEIPQHMGMAPTYQQPPQHAMPAPGGPIDPYHQQPPQHHHHQQAIPPHHQPPAHHPPPPNHNSIPPHHAPQPPQHQQPLPHDENEHRRQISVERSSRDQQELEFSREEEKSRRKYRLDVVQQPERARMCGYGDKDRRPITPPPCVRLIITDMDTGEPIKSRDIDYSMFVLNVDLWDEIAGQEVNLCRQPATNGAPSIAPGPGFPYTQVNGAEAAPPVRYASQGPAPSDMGYNQPPPPPQPQQQPMGYPQDYPVSNGYTQAPNYPPTGSYGPPQQYFPQHQAQGYRPEQSVGAMQTQRYDTPAGYSEASSPSVAYVNDQYKGALNRNLIGSVAASAFCLTDTTGAEGIWFVLQDLSVRLEGKYKLRFSFVNIGFPGEGTRDRPAHNIRRSRAPILASVFSNSFQVYSAKKFPGVWESTSLSKAFATQGIKIPIRKDGGKGGEDDDD